ncbi:hypothetical protein B0I08_105184 [Glaciihabitans tibetensis]|uniref:DUF7144 domain-containing protein n=1 Tax=Glaciihabitans tibetensis TaxID=1266600 RepID=A0A2T0VCX4_9MICO|nr:hypothetical protein [Glaciihabitans tibetensis]PRY68020.1 hypothetical protein B0I08_105184 [Glaciihabitans tibetensis]
MNATRETTGTSTGAQSGARSVQEPTWGGGEAPSAWTGWVVFAGVVMVMMGSFHLIQGFVALFQDTYYVVRASGLVVQLDYTTWGWVHMAIGVLIVVAGIALLAGQLWARIFTVILAFGSAIVNITFMAAYPLWSLALLALDVVVIWAVTVHGDELKS